MIMNNYCKRCRLRDGCLQKCKEAEVYEQGYNDAVVEFKTKLDDMYDIHLVYLSANIKNYLRNL